MEISTILVAKVMVLGPHMCKTTYPIRTSGVAPRGKVPAAKPDDLTLNTGSHLVEGENPLLPGAL